MGSKVTEYIISQYFEGEIDIYTAARKVAEIIHKERNYETNKRTAD